MFLASDRSTLRVPGVMRVFRPALPGSHVRFGLLALNAATFQNCCAVWFAGIGLMPVASGRLVAFREAVSAIWLTLTGVPSASVKIPLSCQPPTIRDITP